LPELVDLSLARNDSPAMLLPWPVPAIEQTHQSPPILAAAGFCFFQLSQMIEDMFLVAVDGLA